MLEEAHAVLPRLRSIESVRVAYEDVGKIHFMKNPALRMRIFLDRARTREVRPLVQL